MIRQKAAKIGKHTGRVKWRSHEPSRLETFSDAVFAFALTLIIVSIEAPKSFDALIETLKGALSFAVCFAILFQIWNSQNIFFRKYGLTDNYTTVLNGCLLFVVLIYAYPLKYLSMLLFGPDTQITHSEGPSLIINPQTVLMLIYGAGYTVIYTLFYLMHQNAARRANELELNAAELYDTKTVAYINLISAAIGILAMLTAIILPERIAGFSGFVYFLIPVTYTWWFATRGKKSRMLFPEGD